MNTKKMLTSSEKTALLENDTPLSADVEHAAKQWFKILLIQINKRQFLGRAISKKNSENIDIEVKV